MAFFGGLRGRRIHEFRCMWSTYWSSTAWHFFSSYCCSFGFFFFFFAVLSFQIFLSKNSYRKSLFAQFGIIAQLSTMSWYSIRRCIFLWSLIWFIFSRLACFSHKLTRMLMMHLFEVESLATASYIPILLKSLAKISKSFLFFTKSLSCF